MLIRKKVSVRPGALTDVTALVAECAEAVPGEGICAVNALDARAGVLVTDGSDPRIAADLLADMERAFPARGSYRAADGPERTAAAVRSAVFGAARDLPVERGALQLGRDQRVLLASYADAEEIELAVTLIF
ncbi:YjbQ family protein [Anaerofilum sp. BX8]|uniref:YjbQ family protein n=1 Tax=Anaerofilum hominis TaxID=2763016 RepID=A0A923L212_9FIRM|nr:YjbQ family protein [Anaerofilum hominis]MBC5582397.1 YjbQ family protein [Anaerofilum hominis]